MSLDGFVETALAEVGAIAAGDAQSARGAKGGWQVHEIRVFVEAYQLRFSEMDPPVPIAEYPLPPDSNCKWCKRSRRHINPIRVGTYVNNPFLPFKSVAAHECVSCRMGQLWGFKDVSKADLCTRLGLTDGTNPDEEFVIVYFFIISCWEIRYVDPKAAIFKNAGDLPESCSISNYSIQQKQAQHL